MRKSLASALIALVISGTAWADFDRGLAAYHSGHFETAFEEFREAAIAGHATAQFNVGMMYYRGEGVPQDVIKAYGWIELATQQRGAKDLLEAQEILSVMLSADEVDKGLRTAERLARSHGLSYRSREQTGGAKIAGQ